MISLGEPRKILVPWNFEEVSQIALKRALKDAKQPSLVHVVHVAPPLSEPDNGLMYAAAEQRKSRELQRTFRLQVRDNELANQIRFSVVYGFVGREIVRYAERCGAGLIVMAAREKKQISRLLFGSTTEQVVRKASCPVLALHGKADGESEQKLHNSNQPATV